MRVAHLSDLHIRDARDVAALAHQLDHIASRSVDHLAITGDLLDRWNPSLLSAVLDALGDCALLDPDRLTILHGNHDLASSGGHPRRRRDLWRLALRFWDPPPLLAWRRRRFYEVLASHAIDVGSPAPFIKTLRRGGARIAAIDTVPLPWRPLTVGRGTILLQHGVGCVRRSQAAWLSRQNGGAPLIVLMHHYPLEVDRYRWEGRVEVRMDIPTADRNVFWEAAEGSGTRLVLCGHVHRARLQHHRGIAVGLNGQSGAQWAGRTIVYYTVEQGRVTAEFQPGTG